LLVRSAVAASVAVGLLFGASAPGWSYMAVKGGLFMPNGDEQGLKDWDNGFGGEVAVGGDFGAFAIDGSVGYFRIEHPDADDLNLAVVPLTLTAKAQLHPAPGMAIYAGGGLGYYVGMLGGDDVSGVDTDDKTGTGVGFHLVGGIELPLGPIGFLAEVKWSQADVEFGDSDDKTNIGGIAVLAGIKF
jgi:opacity protein-like surface antigen